MSEKLPRVDCQDLIRALKRAGFVEERQRGAICICGTCRIAGVSVPVHKGRIVPIGTLKAILRDADISPEKFRELL